MEESSFQAIYTGVYIFVFIAALTTTLYMFRNVNELAENAYNYGESVTTESVITAPAEKTNLTKEDVISYYFNYIKKDKYDEGSPNTNTINLKINGIAQSNKSYKELINNLNADSYTLTIEKYDDNGTNETITVNIKSNT